jgi:hypothetical protein
MVTIKLAVSPGVPNSEDYMVELETYVRDVLTKDHSLPTMVSVYNDLVVIESDKEGATMVINRLIEDYASLGTECDVDIYSIVTYCDDPELQNFFVIERLNIQAASQESMFEALNDDRATTDSVLNLSKRIGMMDGLLTLNGCYQFKAIVEAIIEELKTVHRIDLLDTVNGCFDHKVN